MSLTIKGKILLILEKQTFSSGFEKREFVIRTSEQYPQDVKFECVKDKVSMLDNLKIGEEVEVSMNIRGNEYQGKYYVNLQAWKITKEATTAAEITKPQDITPNTDTEESDDLPF